MGNYSELYFSEEKTPPTPSQLQSSGSPYLLSKYHIPLLWLALFRSADIVSLKDEDGEEEWPYLVAERESALLLLGTREGFLQSNFPSLDLSWLQLFKSLLEQTPFKYVHVDTSQIGGMVGSGHEWHRELELILGMFSPAPAPPPTFLEKLLRIQTQSKGREWSLFDKRLGSVFQGASAKEPWAYCGSSGTDDEMAWEDDSKSM